MESHHHRYLGSLARGDGWKTAMCSCGWQKLTRSARTTWGVHTASLPDLPIDPTGRNWAIPKHLVVRRPS